MGLATSIFLTFLGGILPALIWLFFWLKQDEKHPEPNNLIILSFVYGMIAVFGSLLLEAIISMFMGQGQDIRILFNTNLVLALIILISWSAIEEATKYFAAYKGGLSKKTNDEPIDPIIYMITAALGFSAMENTLFLFSPIFQGDTLSAFITGNMRFIGATLLHVSASAIIGMAIAFSYYKNSKLKKRYLLSGFILSTILHAVFNSFIIISENFTLMSFIFVWLIIIIIILLFEKIKKNTKKTF